MTVNFTPLGSKGKIDFQPNLDETSAALSNATHLNEHMDAFTKAGDALSKVFPGKEIGQAIGTLAGYIATPKERRQFYDLSHPSVSQVLGDVGKGTVALAGLETALPASIWGKAAQFGAYGGAGSLASAVAEGKPGKEVAKETVEGAGIGAATGGAFGVIGKGIQKILAPFKGTFQKSTAAAFQSEGITPPISAINSNKMLQKTEALAGKGAFGKDVVDQINTATTELEKKTSELVDKITPAKTMSDENIGRTIQEGLKEYEDKFKVTEGKIYDEFSKTYGKSNVYGMATKDALNTLIKEQGSDFFKGTDPRLTKMFSRLTGTGDPELKALDEQLQKLKSEGANPETIKPLEKAYFEKEAELNRDLSFNELKATRTSVGEQLQKEPENTALKRLYGALSNDMQTAVKKIGEQSPLDGDAKAAIESLDKLNKGYATGKAKIESNIAQSISQSNPEMIAQNLVKRNSAATLKTVKEMIGPERFKEISKEFLRSGLEKSVTRNAFDVDKFKKFLASYDKETIDEVISKDQQKDITDAVNLFDKYKTLSDALKSGQKFAAGSQTAFLQALKSTSNRVIAASAALFSGHPTLAGIIGLELAGEYGVAKMLTSDVGRKILTEGINPNNLGLLSQLGYSTAQIAKIQASLGSSETKAKTDY